MLKNNLAAGFKIDQAEAGSRIKQAGFNEKIRAQELSVADWLKLFSVFNKNVV
jgi:16S rRNA A1518/A1519 N6-dimethyltransferase RsmA/KsgA/DIM1 with predicted DNA glycosylase/AP lyase activity